MACGKIGLDIKYLYSLTQRQLHNIVNGYEKKEDYASRERWQIARKIMYGSMYSFMSESFKETDIIVFPWEQKKLIKLTQEEEKNLKEQEAISESFFNRWDKLKAEKK